MAVKVDEGITEAVDVKIVHGIKILELEGCLSETLHFLKGPEISAGFNCLVCAVNKLGTGKLKYRIRIDDTFLDCWIRRNFVHRVEHHLFND